MNNKETNEILLEILNWQKLQGLKILRELIPLLFDDEKKKMVYELTDGKNSQTDIAKKIGIAGGTISNWWNLWYSYGLLLKEKNRYKKLISLKEIELLSKSKKNEKINNH